MLWYCLAGLSSLSSSRRLLFVVLNALTAMLTFSYIQNAHCFKGANYLWSYFGQWCEDGLAALKTSEKMNGSQQNSKIIECF